MTVDQLVEKLKRFPGSYSVLSVVVTDESVVSSNVLGVDTSVILDRTVFLVTVEAGIEFE
ncbi:hypothetical protein KAR91_35065 [Candidatus Pacearchaeota archaeon]|nr:hypothetical protein [Candidatus Pacearchaeota archaeon]